MTEAHLMATAVRPRLFFEASDLPALRARREQGLGHRIWSNLIASADWCLTRPVRGAWIPPLPAEQDPIYERLYDRFYAIMHDLAVLEHLCFAGVLSDQRRYLDPARQWALASARIWRQEAQGEPDGAKAYAVCRLIKALAVAHDLLHDHLDAQERAEVQATLIDLCRRYFDGYFATEPIRGEGFHTHHAIVEWASFGIAALALLGEVPEARTWLDATVRKFETHLLPLGLAEDGAQIEGATFWASTMQYRLFFLDALHRITGRDLFTEFAGHMHADLALAGIAGEHHAGRMEPHRSVALSPSYGQLDYIAPVLLKLAAEYQNPTLQYLAMWDHSLGGIQGTAYITPGAREQLLFELGGYAYLWHDPTIPAEPEESRRTYRFPSVGQAYARAGWRPGDALAALDGLTLQVHARGAGLLIEAHLGQGAANVELNTSDDGDTATIGSRAGDGGQLTLTLHRPNRIHVQRRLDAPLVCWSHGPMQCEGDALVWPDRGQGRVVRGRIERFDPRGHHTSQVVGMGKLQLADDDPQAYPLVTIAPDDGRIELEITLQPGGSATGSLPASAETIRLSKGQGTCGQAMPGDSGGSGIHAEEPYA